MAEKWELLYTSKKKRFKEMRKKGLQRTPFPHLETGVCTINDPQILCFLFFFPRLWDVKKAREFQRLFLEKISKERKREMAPRVYTLWNLWCDGSENWNERLRVRERKVAEKKNLYVKNWELSLKRGNERMLMWYSIPFVLQNPYGFFMKLPCCPLKICLF